MELIKTLDIRKRPNGSSIVRYGLFYCPKCEKEVERSIGDGIRYKSCGCFLHGGHGTRLHNIWHGMKLRCNRKNSDGYRWYGAKGIKVCDEWNKFVNFKDWAIKNGYKDDLTIDRIDPDGDYEPSNCRFISGIENVRRKRSSKLSMLKAEMIRDLKNIGYTSGEISEVFGVSPGNVNAVSNGTLWKK